MPDIPLGADLNASMPGVMPRFDQTIPGELAGLAGEPGGAEHAAKIGEGLHAASSADVRGRMAEAPAVIRHAEMLGKEYEQQAVELGKTKRFRERVATDADKIEGRTVGSPRLSKVHLAALAAILGATMASCFVVSGSYMLSSGMLIAAGNDLALGMLQAFLPLAVGTVLAVSCYNKNTDAARKAHTSQIERWAVILFGAFVLGWLIHTFCFKAEQALDTAVPEWLGLGKSVAGAVVPALQIVSETLAAAAIELGILAIHHRKHPLVEEENPAWRRRYVGLLELEHAWKVALNECGRIAGLTDGHEATKALVRLRVDAFMKRAGAERHARTSQADLDFHRNIKTEGLT